MINNVGAGNLGSVIKALLIVGIVKPMLRGIPPVLVLL